MGATTLVKDSEEAKKQSLEVAEAARETEWQFPSFAGELFMGRFRPGLIFPYPEQGEDDRRVGDEFCAKVETFLRTRVDADAIDRSGELPPDVVQGLWDLGCFRMKIPTEYGGLGFSQVNYNRVAALVASHCGSTAVWLSAHQSIGAPQPLKLFGTPEQKKKYLPRLATGELSAFALTEPNVGSDPASMETMAQPTEDGSAYLINGRKLWCTNGPVADILVVMARTPSVVVNGREKKQVSAFIVERSMPGIKVEHRCRFMGLSAIQNGLISFTNVRVPKENILWGPGLGLKLALITLNTGRLTLPAACVGIAKQCIGIVRDWANERKQWGTTIGKHDEVAGKIASMTAHLFAMESVTWLASAMVDRGGADVRIEAAMAKLFASEQVWRIVDDTMQIRGGRGYETAESLKARGEKHYPVERIMRDARINTIVEGTSEIMHLFLAREALDPHLRVAGAFLDAKLPMKKKLAALGKSISFYSRWYPSTWNPMGSAVKSGLAPQKLMTHLKYVQHKSRRLARTIFHAMMVYQAKLERRERVLARLVNVGVDLFAMAASCARADMLTRKNPTDATPIEAADHFCRLARERIASELAHVFENQDRSGYRLAQEVLEGKFTWLEKGIVNLVK